MDFEIIETNRLTLRKITPQVMEAIHDLTDSEMMNVLGLKSSADLDREKEKYEKGMSTYNKSFLYFQLLDKETQLIIGWCGYYTWYLDHDRAELGYWLYLDEVKQKGLMTEALHVIINFGFHEMKLNRIEAFVSENNVPSLKLLKRYKFKQEGILREHYIAKVKAEDSLVFALLKKDYK